MMATTTVYGVELKTPPTHVGNKLYDSRTENRITLLQSKLDEKEEIISGCQKENLELERKLKEQTTDSQKLNQLHEKTVLDFKKQAGPVTCIDQVLSDENERLKEQIKQLQIDNSEKTAKIDQLQLSLSKVAAEKMVNGNPYITDLSDRNRPMKLTEKFNSLYDNYWTDAYEILVLNNTDERTVCQQLLLIMQSCWEYCREYSRKQLEDLYLSLLCLDFKDEDTKKQALENCSSRSFKLIKDTRRCFGQQIIPNLYTHYWEHNANDDVAVEKSLKPFVEACLELCWYSITSDPPLHYAFSVDKVDDFRGYTKGGEDVDYVVWPAMYLYEYGPLIYKGVVQFKNSDKN